VDELLSDARNGDDRRYGFGSSIVSYPDRGPDGDPKWRGNTSGRLVRDFLGTYHRDRATLFCDPRREAGPAATPHAPSESGTWVWTFGPATTRPATIS
jgi:hypothetical protein